MPRIRAECPIAIGTSIRALTCSQCSYNMQPPHLRAAPFALDALGAQSTSVGSRSRRRGSRSRRRGSRSRRRGYRSRRRESQCRRRVRAHSTSRWRPTSSTISQKSCSSSAPSRSAVGAVNACATTAPCTRRPRMSWPAALSDHEHERSASTSAAHTACAAAPLQPCDHRYARGRARRRRRARA
jgi:hypothetical protein